MSAWPGWRKRGAGWRILAAASISILVLAAAGSRPAPGEEQGIRDSSEEAGHHEQQEDPYIAVPRGTQLKTRAMLVSRGQFHSVQVNVDSSGNNLLGDAANEPSLAVDPTNPANLVIGWRQFDTVASNFRQAGYAYSHDGGASWTFPGVIDPGQFRSDPVVTANSGGTFYYYALSSATGGDLFISTDKGQTWSGPTPGLGGDKEWMALDATGGQGNGNLYLDWNSQFTCCAAGTDFARSIDGGASFQAPLGLPSKQKWGTLAVGGDGTLFAAGTRIDDLAFPVPHLVMKSTNAQVPWMTPVFGAAVGINLGGVTTFGTGPNPGGILGQVWVAVDASNTPTKGYVYVLASVDPPGSDPLDVMFTRSTDGGTTWGLPMRINDDPPGSAWQWFGTMSVAPNGRIDVVWNDSRNDPTGSTAELFYAYSTSAGATWSASLPVTPAWNWSLGYPNQNKIGDYYQMVSDANGAGVAYAATFNGEQDIYFLRVGDCNGNGRHDSVDILMHTSLDCNVNGIPDECEETPPACSLCVSNATCDDGIFCNGAETCNLATGRCQAPLVSACDDGNACTTDSCDAQGNSCTHVPLPPPGLVGNTVQATQNDSTGVTTVTWTAATGAVQYNSYRGTLPAGTMGSRPGGPYDHVCFESADAAGNGSMLSSDAAAPPVGTGFYYLVSGENACAEGSLGQASDLTPRPNPAPCPTPP
jgi:slime mold repeat-containing protein